METPETEPAIVPLAALAVICTTSTHPGLSFEQAVEAARRRQHCVIMIGVVCCVCVCVCVCVCGLLAGFQSVAGFCRVLGY